MLDIYQIAEKAGIKKEYVIPYGLDKAKIDLKIKDEIKCKIEEEILTFRIEFFNV